MYIVKLILLRFIKTMARSHPKRALKDQSPACSEQYNYTSASLLMQHFLLWNESTHRQVVVLVFL